MSRTIGIMSMSLDGFVADVDGGVAEVFDWYAAGDVEVQAGGADAMAFRMSAASAEHFRDLTAGLGAVITGRRTFDAADGWGGRHAWGPAFVLSHTVPDGWPRPGSSVHFVHDGIEAAVGRALEAAGGGSVALHGADTIRQCLRAGLLGELALDVAAVLLGSGVPMFDHVVEAPAVLGDPEVVQGVGVTHLRYAVRR